jgi:LynF/TruF/PatF family peptide O-prenyltransferase
VISEALAQIDDYCRCFCRKATRPALLARVLEDWASRQGEEAQRRFVHIEFSHKFTPDEVFSRRVNVWFHREHGIEWAETAFDRIEQQTGRAIDRSFFRQLASLLETETPIITALGIDDRPDLSHARLKFWAAVSSPNPALWQWALSRAAVPAFMSDYARDFLLVGMESSLDGNETRIKPYLTYKRDCSDVLKKCGNLPPAILGPLEQTAAVHFALRAGGEPVLHTSAPPWSFVEHPALDQIRDFYTSHHIPYAVASILPSEAETGKIRNFNLYFSQ